MTCDDARAQAETRPNAGEVRVRTAWITPSVQKIAAGEAEVGTRNRTSDGAFTSS